jgi:hypothetical protein
MTDSPDSLPPGAPPSAIDDEGDGALFDPVPLRYRRDGWLPDKQLEFIEALADCGCLDEAAKRVGMSRNSAYALRRRPDAQAFRLAWDAAADYSVRRLADAAMSRAINGVPIPIFHGGEQIGERRHFDERLTMFLLSRRDPARYGRWIDRMATDRHEDGGALLLLFRIARLVRAAWRAFDAAMRGEKPPEPLPEPVRTGREEEDGNG